MCLLTENAFDVIRAVPKKQCCCSRQGTIGLLNREHPSESEHEHFIPQEQKYIPSLGFFCSLTPGTAAT